MAVSVLDFSMSLDGYIAGPNDTPETTHMRYRIRHGAATEGGNP